MGYRATSSSWLPRVQKRVTPIAEPTIATNGRALEYEQIAHFLGVSTGIQVALVDGS